MKKIGQHLGIDARAQLLAERLWQYLEEPSSGIFHEFYRDTQQSAAGILLNDQMIERLFVKQEEHRRLQFNGGFDKADLHRAAPIGIKPRESGLCRPLAPAHSRYDAAQVGPDCNS